MTFFIYIKHIYVHMYFKINNLKSRDKQSIHSFYRKATVHAYKEEEQNKT